MNKYEMSTKDYEGYGVYERDYLGMGAFGQLPNLSTLQDFEDIGGLAHVPVQAKPGAKAALELMVPQSSDDDTFTASFILGQTGGAWVADLVTKGAVVMVERASIAGGAGVLTIYATDRGDEVVGLASTPNPPFVIVDGHPAVLAAALAQRNLPGVPVPVPGLPVPVPGLPPIPGVPALIPGAPCPAGMVGTAWPDCKPLPGDIPDPGPEPEDAKVGLPTWVVPLAIAGGAIALVAGIAAYQSEGRMRRNPRRRFKTWPKGKAPSWRGNRSVENWKYYTGGGSMRQFIADKMELGYDLTSARGELEEQLKFYKDSDVR
jgi:hypothetical protein